MLCFIVRVVVVLITSAFGFAIPAGAIVTMCYCVNIVIWVYLACVLSLRLMLFVLLRLLFSDRFSA